MTAAIPKVLRRDVLAGVKRLVLKLGTRVVTVHDNELDRRFIDRIACEVSGLMLEGYQVAIVSSGAVGAGMGRLGLKDRPLRIPDLQATAAVGQGLLMNAYKLAFRAHDVPIGQVLLTDDGLEDRWRYVNAKNTLEALFKFGAVPIVNENDSVAVEENKVGDNDRLSALVTHLVEAQLLITYTTVDGLYTKDPSKRPEARHIPVVDTVTDDMIAAAGEAGSAVSLGGMRTKLQAARSVTQGGGSVVIASGRQATLRAILSGEEMGTLFMPKPTQIQGRKRWLANTRKKGVVFVDSGAARALTDGGKSLLASGIVRMDGAFDVGELIEIADESGVEIARGLVRYTADEVHLIMGKQSEEIPSVLNGKAAEAVIHRDDMVIL
ncbi:MAG: glutamate 5-kinase [Gemmatimonadetes bacterium]|nr:glutamate 5-kinase [Gemmatimonadota bacterium]HCK11588.1 glutamate 5-kinase [Candidatus Latescibacterota bacterium]